MLGSQLQFGILLLMVETGQYISLDEEMQIEYAFSLIM